MGIGKESILYKRVKENLPNSLITKLENRSQLGTPDLLIGFSNPSKFVTVELKVVESGKKIKFSPHQYSFHVRHSKLPAFILVHWIKEDRLLLYHAKQIMELAEAGCLVEPVDSWSYKNIMWSMLRFRFTSV